MKQYIFVPLSDDVLYDHPERILGRVVPFSNSRFKIACISAPDDRPITYADQYDLLQDIRVAVPITKT